MKLYGYIGQNEEDVIEITEKTFLIDGYEIADRLLEGVMFEVSFDLDKITNVNVQPEFKYYFDDLNTKKWLTAVRKDAERKLKNGGDITLSNELIQKYNLIDEDGYVE